MGASRPESLEGVSFLGRVSEEVKEQTLRSAEVYVAPNLGGESFGIVLVEAMTAGCAVIASDLVSFRDVADSSARFFPVGNATSLGDLVVEVLGNPETSHRLSVAGRRRSGRFSWDEVGPAYRACYEEISSRVA
jgi:phosphatidylinositol alpha-mannosyltransferase